MDRIINELSQAWKIQDKDQIEDFILEILRNFYQKTFIGIGAGRMGFSLRSFIMRLGHMNAKSFFIGDTCLPKADNNSTIILNSSSGETKTNVIFAEQAKLNGAGLLLITQNSKSTIGNIADYILEIPRFESKQIMKTFPEQYSFILLDYISSRIIEELNLSNQYLKSNHSIFE